MLETQRKAQKAATRRHIIETALEQYSKNGLLKTTTADIAKAAKVSHGTIFVHFPTQEDLLTAVIEEFGARLKPRLHELADKSNNLSEALKAHLLGLEEFEGFYTKLITERRLLPESARNTYIVIQSTISFHITMVAEKEMQSGIIRKMPIHLLYNTWVGIIHYYLTNSDLFAPDGSSLKRYGDELLEHFMSLITK